MSHIHIVTCQMISEEVQDAIRTSVAECDYSFTVVEPALHQSPEKLRHRLQTIIDSASAGSTLCLIMGRCGGATTGLHSKQTTLIIPRVDDCIGILLGSRQRFIFHSSAEPGTYYLSKGWVLHSETPDIELGRCIRRHNEALCQDAIKMIYRHYSRVLYIRTNIPAQEPAFEKARQIADALGLRFEETNGSIRLIKDLLSVATSNHPWQAAGLDENLIVVPPYGSVIEDLWDV